jgi:hypothetical protein
LSLDSGKRLNKSCSFNDTIPCGANSICSSSTSTCVCPAEFTVYQNTCGKQIDRFFENLNFEKSP